ncbi:MAG: ribosome maturation factor RimM [candidate division Zixibacteria bacterium]|nr:ribosome maturation factor RimM [candidate division Zixibacteria bacterium]MDH3937369.1 ribosome maturation factor RimM [candidate division Zixibacteria bacterium]MDH4035429.1 ribosome maturation factor RimM [candidate division Zixibacteria bacterium]
MGSDELVIVGKLGRPRGVQGEMYITPLTDFPERFNGMEEIHVRSRDGWEKMKIVSAGLIGQRPVIRFEVVGSPEEAARMTNRELAIPKDELVTLPEGEYFVFELIGCDVFEQTSGQQIGELIDVEKYPANDVYIVQAADDKQLQVPAVGEFVKEIDVIAKRILIDTSGLADY